MPRRSISYVLVKISYWDNQAPLGIKLFKRMSFNGEDTPNEIVLILIHCTAIHYGAAEHPICFIDVFCSCCSFCTEPLIGNVIGKMCISIPVVQLICMNV